MQSAPRLYLWSLAIALPSVVFDHSVELISPAYTIMDDQHAAYKELLSYTDTSANCVDQSMLLPQALGLAKHQPSLKTALQGL